MKNAPNKIIREPRLVRLVWKKRTTKQRRAEVMEYCRHFYECIDEPDSLYLKAERGDLKLVWIYMISGTFSDICESQRKLTTQ